MILISVAWCIAAIGCSSQNTGTGNQSNHDTNALQGRWFAITGESRGKPMSAAELNRINVTFAGKGFTISEEGGKGTTEETFAIDSAKTPKEIDFSRHQGPVKLGIYEFTKGELRICVDESGEARPKEFSTGDGLRIMLVLKRKKS